MQSPINDVSDTALWVASYRADETARSDALFRDPLAARLLGERGRSIARAMKGSRYTAWSVVIRTCVIDEFLKELISSGQIDTVLNLGTGLDTRPYRMELPASFRWIEVDFPQIIELKESRLSDEKPCCQLKRIKLDLSDRELRRQMLSDVCANSKKVLVLTEGVVPYLTPEQVAELARDLHSQAQICFWLLDYFAPEIMRFFKKGRVSDQLKNAPFRFFLPDWFGFFSSHGWKPKEIRYLIEESKKRGRRYPIPWWVRILGAFQSREQKSARSKYLGYVLLEPVR